MKKIIFVNPFYTKSTYETKNRHFRVPSLVLPTLVACTPDKYKAVCIDENIPGQCAMGCTDVKPFIVAITVHTTSANRAYHISNYWRSKGVIVVLGGLHVSSLPDEAVKYADAICIGNAYSIWAEIIKDAELGQLQKRYYSRSSIESFGTIDVKKAHRKLVDERVFMTNSSAMVTEGCVQKCDFCVFGTVPGIQQKLTTMDVGKAISHLRELEDEWIIFLDNNLTGIPGRAIQLFHEMAHSYDFMWSAAVAPETGLNLRLLDYMAASGCIGVFIGFESISADNLIDINKRIKIIESYEKIIKNFHERGISINASFVFGLDDDTISSFEETICWCEKNKIDWATFHILTPYPGTGKFNELNREGRIFSFNWDEYDTTRAVFHPKNMTPKELERGLDYSYKRFYSYRSMWKRARGENFFSKVFHVAHNKLFKRSNVLWSILVSLKLNNFFWKIVIKVVRFMKRSNKRKYLKIIKEKYE